MNPRLAQCSQPKTNRTTTTTSLLKRQSKLQFLSSTGPAIKHKQIRARCW